MTVLCFVLGMMIGSLAAVTVMSLLFVARRADDAADAAWFCEVLPVTVPAVCEYAQPCPVKRREGAL